MASAGRKQALEYGGQNALNAVALKESGADRPDDQRYPLGMGLRPKACPRPRRGISPTTWKERSSQGQVDRCLTLVHSYNTDLHGSGNSGSDVQTASAMDTQGALASQASVSPQGPRPSQSPSRDRTQSWWDVLPVLPKCGKDCFMCGAPCNRPFGKHFIRLIGDRPAHLCFHCDLHELYGE